MWPFGRAQALDGEDRLSVQRADLDGAGRLVLAVDQHRAGAALPRPAAEARPGQLQLVAQDIEQCFALIGLDPAFLAIHHQLDFTHKWFLPTPTLTKAQGGRNRLGHS